MICLKLNLKAFIINNFYNLNKQKFMEQSQQNFISTATIVTAEMKQNIKDAWAIDPNWHIFFYVFWVIAYLGTAAPSASGVVPISSARSFIYWYLVIDAIARFVDIDNHPDDEKYIWTISNWALNCLRRIIIEYVIFFIYPFT